MKIWRYITGNYHRYQITNRQLLFAKELDGQSLYVALNLDENAYDMQFNTQYSGLVDVLTGKIIPVENGCVHLHIEPYSSMILVNDDIVNVQPEPKPEKEETPVEIAVGQQYVDLKGNTYTITAIATHSETLEELVIYTNSENQTLASPKSIFMENIGDVKRFRLLS